MAKTKSKTAYSKDSGMTLFANLLLILAALCFCAVLGVGYYNCQVKQDSYDLRLGELNAQIAAQNRRTKEIEEYEKYTHTKKYVEEIAREKLGLVYPGEIVFMPEEK